MENENSTKELDLIDIIRICWGWFVSYVFCPAVAIIKFCLKRWWVGVIAVCVGLLASILLGSLLPKYTGHIIFRNNVCSSSDFIGDVRLMSKIAPEAKMQNFHLSYKKAKSIKAIWAHQLCYLDTLHTSYVVDLDDRMAENGKYCVQNMFDVEIVVTDLAVLDSIQDALVYYFSRAPFYVQQNNERCKSLQSSINIIGMESGRLDSTRGKWDSPVLLTDGTDRDGKTVATLLNPTIVSNELIRLHDVTNSLENALNFNPYVVSVVTPLRFNPTPTNFFLFTWKKYVALCLVAAYLLTVVILYRRKIIDFING